MRAHEHVRTKLAKLLNGLSSGRHSHEAHSPNIVHWRCKDFNEVTTWIALKIQHTKLYQDGKLQRKKVLFDYLCSTGCRALRNIAFGIMPLVVLLIDDVVRAQ